MEPKSWPRGKGPEGSKFDKAEKFEAKSPRAPGGGAAIRPLPAVKENVKKVMYYI
jgi:hypothetical protein